MNYYIYAYLRPDGTPYYIGKGKGNRINQKTMRKVKVPDHQYRVKLHENLSVEEAMELERQEIDRYGRARDGGILANTNRGGSLGNTGNTGTAKNRRKWVPKNSRPVICLNTGKIYRSIRNAAVELDIWEGSIANVCRGKQKKIRKGGLVFEFLDKYQGRNEVDFGRRN